MSIEISDSAVEAATYAFANDTGNTLQAMRAALAAAMPLIVGEPVGTMEIDRSGAELCFPPTRKLSIKEIERRYGVGNFPLYAIKQGASRG